MIKHTVLHLALLDLIDKIIIIYNVFGKKLNYIGNSGDKVRMHMDRNIKGFT